MLSKGYQPTLKMYGRSFLQSRQIIAFGDEAAADSIKYSGTEVPLMKEHPPIMAEIQSFLEKELGTKFNHCMLNLYESGKVHIGSHSDNLGAVRPTLTRIKLTVRYREPLHCIDLAGRSTRLHPPAQEATF